MPSRFDKICVLCGARHKYCGHCDDYKHLEPWHESFDNDNCHTIFNLIMDYRTGTKTPAECKKAMEVCDLSYRDKFSEGMNAFITAILSVTEGLGKAEAVEETTEVVKEEAEPKTEDTPAVETGEDSAPAEKVNKSYDYKKFSSNKKRK